MITLYLYDPTPVPEIVGLGQAIAKEASPILIIKALQIAKEIAEEAGSQCAK